MRFSKVVFVLFLFVVLLVQFAIATQIYVSTTGNDTVGNGSVGNPFLTIQHAIDNATDYDTISVAAGLYDDYVDIDKKITLQGAGKENTTVTHDADYEVIYIESSDVKISGFKVDAQGISEDTIAIDGYATYDNINIFDNHLTNCTKSSLYFYGWWGGGYPGNVTGVATGWNFSDNTIDAFGATSGSGGILVFRATGVQTKRNIIKDSNAGSGVSHTGTGIYYQSDVDGNIEDNNISDVYGGIVVNGVIQNSFITNNHVSDVVIGVHQVECGAMVTMTGNEVSVRQDPSNSTIPVVGIILGGDKSATTYPLMHDVHSNVVTGDSSLGGEGIRVMPGSIDEDYGASGTVTDNNISFFDTCLKVYGTYKGGSKNLTNHVDVSFSENSIIDCTVDAAVDAVWSRADGGINATYNWWGTADLATLQVGISGKYDFIPYYVDAEMTILSSPCLEIHDNMVISGNLTLNGSCIYNMTQLNVTVADGVVLDCNGATLQGNTTSYSGNGTMPVKANGTSSAVVLGVGAQLRDCRFYLYGDHTNPLPNQYTTNPSTSSVVKMSNYSVASGIVFEWINLDSFFDLNGSKGVVLQDIDASLAGNQYVTGYIFNSVNFSDLVVLNVTGNPFGNIYIMLADGFDNVTVDGMPSFPSPAMFNNGKNLVWENAVNGVWITNVDGIVLNNDFAPSPTTIIIRQSTDIQLHNVSSTQDQYAPWYPNFLIERVIDCAQSTKGVLLDRVNVWGYATLSVQNPSDYNCTIEDVRVVDSNFYHNYTLIGDGHAFQLGAWTSSPFTGAKMRNVSFDNVTFSQTGTSSGASGYAFQAYSHDVADFYNISFNDVVFVAPDVHALDLQNTTGVSVNNSVVVHGDVSLAGCADVVLDNLSQADGKVTSVSVGSNFVPPPVDKNVVIRNVDGLFVNALEVVDDLLLENSTNATVNASVVGGLLRLHGGSGNKVYGNSVASLQDDTSSRLCFNGVDNVISGSYNGTLPYASCFAVHTLNCSTTVPNAGNKPAPAKMPVSFRVWDAEKPYVGIGSSHPVVKLNNTHVAQGCVASVVDNYTTKYSCNETINYYYSPQAYDLFAKVNTTQGNENDSASGLCLVSTLLSAEYSTGRIDFNAKLGDVNRHANQVVHINNTGNVVFDGNVTVTARSLVGATLSQYVLDAANFKVNDVDSVVGAVTLQDGVPRNVPVTIGLHDYADLHYFATLPSNTYPQKYVSVNPWVVSVSG